MNFDYSIPWWEPAKSYYFYKGEMEGKKNQEWLILLKAESEKMKTCWQRDEEAYKE